MRPGRDSTLPDSRSIGSVFKIEYSFYIKAEASCIVFEASLGFIFDGFYNNQLVGLEVAMGLTSFIVVTFSKIEFIPHVLASGKKRIAEARPDSK